MAGRSPWIGTLRRCSAPVLANGAAQFYASAEHSYETAAIACTYLAASPGTAEPRLVVPEDALQAAVAMALIGHPGDVPSGAT